MHACMHAHICNTQADRKEAEENALPLLPQIPRVCILMHAYMHTDTHREGNVEAQENE